MRSEEANKQQDFFVREWISDLEDVLGKEEVCIISGEGYYPAMEILYPYFESAATNKKVKFKTIIGPVVSVNAKGDNPLITLAKNNLMTLYKAPSRERIHSRAFGYRKLFTESYHLPIARPEERTGKRSYDPLIVSKHVQVFYDKIKVFEMPEYKGNFNTNEFICLTLDEIGKLKTPLGEYYDALFENEIRELVNVDDRSKIKLLNNFKSQNVWWISQNLNIQK